MVWDQRSSCRSCQVMRRRSNSLLSVRQESEKGQNFVKQARGFIFLLSDVERNSWRWVSCILRKSFPGSVSSMHSDKTLQVNDTAPAFCDQVTLHLARDNTENHRVPQTNKHMFIPLFISGPSLFSFFSWLLELSFWVHIIVIVLHDILHCICKPALYLVLGGFIQGSQLSKWFLVDNQITVKYFIDKPYLIWIYYIRLEI